MVTHRSHGVLQRTPATGMHMYIASGDQWQVQHLPGFTQLCQALIVILTTVQLYREP